MSRFFLEWIRVSFRATARSPLIQSGNRRGYSTLASRARDMRFILLIRAGERRRGVHDTMMGPQNSSLTCIKNYPSECTNCDGIVARWTLLATIPSQFVHSLG